MSSAQPPLNLSQWIEPPSPDAWDAVVQKTLRGRSLESLARRSASGIHIDVVQGEAKDVAPTGRSGPWARRQEVRSTRLKAAAKNLAEDVIGGVDAPWVRVDSATLLGVRPDEVRDGGCNPGVALLTQGDLAGLLRRMDFGHSTVVLEAGANSLALLSSLIRTAEGRGVGPEELKAVVQGDPLYALMRTGQLPRGVDAAFDDLAACSAYVGKNCPHVRVVSVSAAPVAEAGGTVDVQLGVLLASALETARAFQARGIGPEHWMHRAEFGVVLGSELLGSIVALRAARRLLGRLVLACGGGHAPVTLHATMSERQVSARDAWSNLLRSTQAGFAGAVGGADALTLLPHDHALGGSTADSRRIARNLHSLLAEESHLDRVEDPAAGSGAIESWTEALCEQAWSRMQAIEQAGGLLAALADGTVASWVDHGHEQERLRVRTRAQSVIGVSRYIADDSVQAGEVEDPSAYDQRLRGRWNSGSMVQDRAMLNPVVQAAMSDLCEGRGDRVQAALVAARAGCLLASIAGAIPGMPFTSPVLSARRVSQEWEALHRAVRQVQPTPGVFLVNVGPVVDHQARAGFARDLFRAGGFELHDNDGFLDPHDAVAAFEQSGCDRVCFCGTDAAYLDVVPTLTPQLRAAGARSVLVAGAWPASAEVWRAAGVDDVVHRKADVFDVLSRLAQRGEGAQ
ncbi:MAG: methylmalonyl-CoA mutase family protein [Myxococcota bacterium]